MSCDVLTLHIGSCISFVVTFTDGVGDPVDITGDTLTIESASVSALSKIEITKIDPLKGQARLHLSEADAADIPLGAQSSFRIGRHDGSCMTTTNKIWVDHK